MYLLDTDANPTAPKYRGRPQKPLLLLQEFLRRNRPVMEVVFTRFEYGENVPLSRRLLLQPV